MNTADRRVEIISILLAKRHITAKELAVEFNVTVRTIHNDIQALSFGFPIYTKQGRIWFCNFVILIKHIINERLFIADRSVIVCSSD